MSKLKIPHGMTGLSSSVDWIRRYRLLGVEAAWEVIKDYFDKLTEEGKRDCADFGYNKVHRHHVCGVKIKMGNFKADSYIDCDEDHKHECSSSSRNGVDIDGVLVWFEIWFYVYKEKLYDIPESYREERKNKYGYI